MQTEKRSEFEKFKTVVEMMIKGEHLDPKGREKILEIASSMNRKKRRSKESSETIRRTARWKSELKIWSDPRSDTGST